jgi:outer membrane receptor protein involved in Fe transport
VVGNPQLEEETSTQLDLALRYGAARRRVAFYAYRYEIDDLVERYADGDNFRFRNRGEAVITGVEAESQIDLTEVLRGDFGAAWADGEADGSDPLADISAPNGWLGLRWANGAAHLHGRVTVVLEKDDPGPAEKARPGYTLFDLGGGWRFSEALELRVMVRNLGDKFYIAAADELSAPSPGRTLQISLSGRL